MRHGVRAVAAVALGWGMIAAAPVKLQSSRAIYKVSLARSLPGGIVAVNGRIVVEFRVTCTAYETTQRFVSDMSGPENNVSRSDYAITATEAKAGGWMRFDVINMVDGQIAEHYRGRAERKHDGSGLVTLRVPGKSEFPLPEGTIFPEMQTIDVIEAAESGKHRVTGPVFQGGGQTDLYYSTATIGKRAPARETDREAASAGAMLKNVPAWPVLMSYYPMNTQSETPAYEIAARLYANGVIGSMSMIYSRFSLRATLQKVEKLSTPPC